MENYKITPINTGFTKTDKGTYIYHHSTHKYYNIDGFTELPVNVYLIEGGNKKILIDTGMSNTEIAGKYHHPGSYQPDGFAIQERLKELGISADEIDMIIFTHLHWDHVYNLGCFKNAKLIVQKLEYDYALNPIPLYYKSYEYPILGIRPQFDGRVFQLVDGEKEIIDGICVYLSPGHSIGHQTVTVNTAKGVYHCCGDLIFSYDNLKEIPEIHYTITPPGRFLDINASWKSIEELKRRVKDKDFILPTHVTEVMNLVDVNGQIG